MEKNEMFPSREIIDDKIAKLICQKLEQLEDIYGVSIEYIDARATLPVWEDSMRELAMWLQEKTICG